MADRKPAILLTGKPRIGKTTIIKQVVGQLEGGAGGFYSREIREKGRRAGFEIVTLGGKTDYLALKKPTGRFPRQASFSGYTVNLHAVETLAVPAILAAMEEGKIVVVDEIGPMEIISGRFCDAVMEILQNEGATVVGTIVRRPDRFADRVKSHPRVTVVEVTLDNRDTLSSKICEHVSLLGTV